MSVLDKNLFLGELRERLEQYMPAPEVARALESAGEALAAYDVTCLGEQGPDADSEGLIRLYLDAKASEGKSPKTVERYRYVLHRLREHLTVPIAKVTVYHLRSYISDEMARGISLTTLEGNRSVWCAFYGWLCKEGLLVGNPTANLAPIKRQKEVKLPYSTEDILRLQDAAAGKARDTAMLTFFLSTGCRVSEVCSVNREDVDLVKKRLVVLGKGNKERTVYIDDAAALRLQVYLASRTDDSPALFPGRASERLTPGGIRAMLHRLGQAAGVENVHPHRFHRTLATGLIDGGMSVQEVARVLGHEKLDTTMGYVYVDERNVEHSYRRAM